MPVLLKQKNILHNNGKAGIWILSNTQVSENKDMPLLIIFCSFALSLGESVSIQERSSWAPTLWNIPLNLTTARPLNIFSTLPTKTNLNIQLFLFVNLTFIFTIWNYIHLHLLHSYAALVASEPLLQLWAAFAKKSDKFAQIFAIYQQCIFHHEFSYYLSFT